LPLGSASRARVALEPAVATPLSPYEWQPDSRTSLSCGRWSSGCMTGLAVMHYQIIEMLGEGGMRPNRCWCSPSGDRIAPDSAPSLQRSGFDGRIDLPKPTFTRLIRRGGAGLNLRINAHEVLGFIVARPLAFPLTSRHGKGPTRSLQ
jgi:hypothetical protein